MSRSDILSAFTTTDASICSRLTHDFAAEGFSTWKVSSAAGVVAVSGPEDDHEARIARDIAAAVPGVRRVKFTDIPH